MAPSENESDTPATECKLMGVREKNTSGKENTEYGVGKNAI